MEKIIYLCFARRKMTPEARRMTLLEHCAPKLLEAGAEQLLMNIDDDVVGVSSPAPTTIYTDTFDAEVSVWVKKVDDRFEFEDILRAAGFDIAGYRVEEQIYTDYGGNQHGSPRDWPDGEKSPAVVSVTPLERKKGLSRDKWFKQWFGRQSPMSEAIQPRSRYVRNVVLEVLTEGATPFEGIVEESWPSPKHVRNQFLFYGATNIFGLIKNIAIMTHSVSRFLPMMKITSVTTSEYFMKSGYQAK